MDWNSHYTPTRGGDDDIDSLASTPMTPLQTSARESFHTSVRAYSPTSNPYLINQGYADGFELPSMLPSQALEALNALEAWEALPRDDSDDELERSQLSPHPFRPPHFPPRRPLGLGSENSGFNGTYDSDRESQDNEQIGGGRGDPDPAPEMPTHLCTKVKPSHCAADDTTAQNAAARHRQMEPATSSFDAPDSAAADTTSSIRLTEPAAAEAVPTRSHAAPPPRKKIPAVRMQKHANPAIAHPMPAANLNPDAHLMPDAHPTPDVRPTVEERLGPARGGKPQLKSNLCPTNSPGATQRRNRESTPPSDVDEQCKRNNVCVTDEGNEYENSESPTGSGIGVDERGESYFHRGGYFEFRPRNPG
ncbi:hypothetical protein B0H19DRAFT_1061635 [Mycena capillaripes]|nr:hypothetical protein B0H19DRAFT_1061635 [Mycena capillaripes]